MAPGSIDFRRASEPGVMLGVSAGLLTSPLQMKSVRNVSGALRAATALSFRPVVRKTKFVSSLHRVTHLP